MAGTRAGSPGAQSADLFRWDDVEQHAAGVRGGRADRRLAPSLPGGHGTNPDG
ncbi:hypothetical protein [Streptomyces ziwulingensis]|uniref:Uncharacterized protein n=1 Tax=Streptomyces ziwulingensis TaxID=1045501 RepID=A0ABP9AKJ9_9ACTN